MTGDLPANTNTRPSVRAYELAAQAYEMLREVERLTRNCGAHHDDARAAVSAAARLKMMIGAAHADLPK